jgi:LysR family transcriptional activator of dmlA
MHCRFNNPCGDSFTINDSSTIAARPMKRDWDLADLRVFCNVARRSSFNGAATELGISPAYVSKRVSSLEQALGATLFHRTTRRVMITEAGETAYAWAKRVLEAADALHQEVSGSRKSLSGVLRVSTSLRLGRNHVSPILGLLSKRHSGLEIWLELVDRRVDLLDEGFDVDIRMGEVSEPHLVAHLVAPNARVLCASPSYLKRRGHPKTLAELARHECLLYRERHQTFGVWRMHGPHGIESVKVAGPMGSNHSDIVRNWALEGRGITLLASWDVAAQLRDGSMLRVLPEFNQPADIWAVTPSRLDDSLKLRVCVEFLVRHLQRGAHALDTSVR